MPNVLIERLRQGHRTVRLRDASASLPERFRGRPQLDESRCRDHCRARSIISVGSLAHANGGR